MSFSLIWPINYEFLTGKGDNVCGKIVKEEYFTFVRLEMQKLIAQCQARNAIYYLQFHSVSVSLLPIGRNLRIYTCTY